MILIIVISFIESIYKSLLSSAHIRAMVSLFYISIEFKVILLIMMLFNLRFAGNINRETAESILSVMPDGSFLVRKKGAGYVVGIKLD